MPILGIIASADKNVPNAPTIGTATNVGTGRAYNNGAATVTFTAPTYTGGFPITSYTVTSNTGGFTASGASSPITVTGLQSDTSYTFTVTATTSFGTSVPSAASNSILATTVPQAPTIGTAVADENAAFVAYTANATGGSAITTFTATSNPGSFTGTGASPITVSGLTNGTSYNFTVTATNANGTSLPSSASNNVIPAVQTSYDLIGNMYGSAVSMTISSIPQTYRSLILKGQASLPSGYQGRIYLRLNGVSTGTIYWPRWYYVTGDSPGVTVAPQTAANELQIGQTQIAGNYTRVFEIEIPYYTQTESKSISVESGLVFNSGSVSDVTFGGGQFASGSPITSVTLYTDNAIGFSNWNQTTVALYGVKG